MVADIQQVDEALLLAAMDLTGAMSTDVEVMTRTLRSTTLTVAAAVPGVGHVGIALIGRNGFGVHPTGDPIADELDAAQVSLCEGPGVEAATRGENVEVPDLALDRRCPRFADVAARHGIVSALALVLRTRERVFGVLTLYAPAALDAHARTVAGALAAQATVAIFAAQRVAGLTRAVNTRDVIGQAKGILIQRDGLDDERAFTMLVQASQATNMKLVDVAHWLVAQTTRSIGTDATVPDETDATVPDESA